MYVEVLMYLDLKTFCYKKLNDQSCCNICFFLQCLNMLKFYLTNSMNFNAEFPTFMRFLFTPRLCKYLRLVFYNPGKAEMAKVIQL